MEGYFYDLIGGSGLQKSEFYEYQKDIFEKMLNGSNIMIQSPRQMGKSFLLLNYALEKIKKTCKVLFLVPNRTKETFFQRFLVMLHFENIDYILDSNSVIDICNGSKVYFCSGDGFDLSIYDLDELDYDDLVIYDEAGYYPFEIYDKPQSILTNTKDCVGYFNKLFKDNDNEFIKISLKWWQHPKWDINWYNKMKEIMDSDDFKVEVLNEEVVKTKDYTVSFRVGDATKKLIDKHVSTLNKSKSEYFRMLINNYEESNFK